MGLRHVLAIVDHHPSGVHAAWRAARVAWAQGATLHLLTLLDVRVRHPSDRHGITAPPVQARVELERVAAQIAEAMGLHPAITVALADEADEVLRRLAREASLVVLPGTAAVAQRRGLAARVLREAGVPVLLTRRPPGAAHRLALVVAPQGDTAIAPLLRAAQWFCRPDAVLACQMLDTAIERDLQSADLSVAAIQAWVETATHRATQALRDKLVQAGLPGAAARVLRGQALARLLAEQRRSGATLMVLPRPRRAWWADLLAPDLSQRLTEGVACDVLWMPVPAATAPAARWRLAALQMPPQDGSAAAGRV